MAKLRQLLLLIWKNFKLQFRHPWVTLLELGVPAFFSLCLVFIRSAISSEYVTTPVIYDPFTIDTLPANLTCPDDETWQLLYVPKTAFLDEIMEDVASNLKVNFTGFDDENSMLNYFSNVSSYILSGIVFNDNLKYGLENITNITYTIRPQTAQGGNSAFENTIKTWYTEYTFPMFPALGPRNKISGWGASPGYMSKGFLTIQHAVAESFMKKLSPDSSKREALHLEMCRYPYPPYLDDKFVLALQLFFPMIICFSFIYPSVNIVKNIVIEKEKKLKEAMKMMGLSRWLHWTAWYIKYFIFLFLSCCIMTVLLCVKFTGDLSVINISDPSVILFWLVTYTGSIISFCFLLSTLFSKANSSAAGAGVIFFLTFIPYFFILPRYNQMSFAEKILACLLPNIAIAMGSIVLTVTEASGNGLQWYNIGAPATPDDTLSLSTIIIMFIVDGTICLILTWYIEAVFPGEYGVPERWYFPFTRSYWCGHHSSYTDMIQFFNSDVNKRSEFFERDPSPELMAGIQIQGLTKVFGKNNTPAVNNISMNMYRSHITVLLGHNGAGKSTTISMLTGLIPPSSGTATVNEFDICEDMDSVHSNLGICPQHDVLFDELTVDEHLYFFCKLKGYISDLVNSDIDRIVTALKLKEKRSTKAEALSGGWKRKLSVGVALVGGSRIVILDEPTSGMDPFNRRSLWDVLQAEKEDRTILLTTHFMEEADVLGDRIAIMANGEIQCCGSPLFLKKKYGAGYHLVMVKEAHCDVPTVTNLITSHVPTAELSSNIGSELKYILPHDSSHLFHDLFSELEKKKKKLNISGYGASITTMEEVFIKVGHKENLEEIETMSAVSETGLSESLSRADSGIHVKAPDSDSGAGDLEDVNYVYLERNTGLRLFAQHLFALLEKRVLHSFRNWVLTLSQLILPPFFLILTILMLKTMPKPHDAPPLVLDLQSYHGTEIPYAVDTKSSESKTLASLFKSQFTDEMNNPVFLDFDKVNMTAYLINKGINDLGKYNLHNMIAAKFYANESSEGTSITTLFNNQAYHSPAIALLETDNTILKYLTNTTYTFAVTNHPLPRTIAEKGKEQQTQTTESYQIAQDIMFGMSFLIASFAIFIIKERGSNSKHLQIVSGVNLFSYWLAALIWDFLNYLIPCCLLIITFACFKTEGLSTPTELGRLFLLFFIHGFSALPFVYCCTFFFMSPSTAYVRLSLFNILVGIACLLTITILEIPDLGVEYVARPLDTLFSFLFPNYGLGRAVSNLYQNYQFNKFCDQSDVYTICEYKIKPYFDFVKPCCKGVCEDVCIPWEKDFLSFTSPGIGKQLVFFALQAVIFTCLLVMCEMNVARYIKYMFKSRKIMSASIPQTDTQSIEIDTIEDDDVKEERMMFLNNPLFHLLPSNPLIIKHVTKKYGSFLAVNQLTFGVRRGECFGLLGLNGAGKTTTFKMITGDESISSGEIYINGYNIKKDIRKVRGYIGYCPQFDALIDQLTGRETLSLFCRLRGIKSYLIPSEINSISELLSFHVHIDKLVKDYSGGNKRKLSTAIALIGNSPVIFLDEPTTGMDPVSRRRMWTALLHIMQSGRSVILTSHSMEECEALCSRLVIMVNGKLCCLGSPQHLKSKFGEGFTLMIKVGQRSLASCNHMRNTFRSPEDVAGHSTCSVSQQSIENTRDMDDIRAFVERTFMSATLKNAHENLLHYHIPNPQLNWSEIFRAMEEAKANLNIEDYSVGETTLEQVFLNFALVQRDS